MALSRKYRKFKDYMTSVISVINLSTDQLSQEATWQKTIRTFNDLGFLKLRGFISHASVHNIQVILASLNLGAPVYMYPIENSRYLQDQLLAVSNLKAIAKVVGPYWYLWSDAYLGYADFSCHRDVFVDPPFIKVLVALQSCTIRFCPGSHFQNDEYARRIGSGFTRWDNGSIVPFITDINLAGSENRIITEANELSEDELFLERDLNPGDAVIFNQSILHSFLSSDTSASFIAFTLISSPSAARKFNRTRSEHLDLVIKSICSSCSIERELANLKGLDSTNIDFHGYRFTAEDLGRLLQLTDDPLDSYFGFTNLTKGDWEKFHERNRIYGPSYLRNTL